MSVVVKCAFCDEPGEEFRSMLSSGTYRMQGPMVEAPGAVAWCCQEHVEDAAVWIAKQLRAMLKPPPGGAS